jgi:hypothetical protein
MVRERGPHRLSVGLTGRLFTRASVSVHLVRRVSCGASWFDYGDRALALEAAGLDR